MFILKKRVKHYVTAKEKVIRERLEKKYEKRVGRLKKKHKEELDKVYKEMANYHKAYEMFKADKEFFKFFRESMSPQIKAYMEKLSIVAGHLNEGESRTFLSDNREGKIKNLMSSELE